MYIYIYNSKCKYISLPAFTSAGFSTTALLRQRSFEGDHCASMTEPWWHHNGTCRLLAKECARPTVSPLHGHLLGSAFVYSICSRGTFVCQRAWAPPLGHWVAFLHKYTTTCPESRIRHPETHGNHGVYFRQSGNPCGILLGRNESSSACPLMTLPVRRPVIRPSVAPIADTLREEFANKGWRLYEIDPR